MNRTTACARSLPSILPTHACFVLLECVYRVATSTKEIQPQCQIWNAFYSRFLQRRQVDTGDTHHRACHISLHCADRCGYHSDSQLSHSFGQSSSWNRV